VLREIQALVRAGVPVRVLAIEPGLPSPDPAGKVPVAVDYLAGRARRPQGPGGIRRPAGALGRLASAWG
jgi:hypothetical protein